MPDTSLPLDGLSRGFSRTTEAAEAFSGVMKETEKAMSDLRGQTTASADDQKKSVDKLRKAISKQADTINQQSKAGGENSAQLKSLAERTKQASALLNSFGEHTDEREWSILNSTVTSLSDSLKNLDISGQRRASFELEDEKFKKWISEPNFGLSKDSVTFMQRLQADTARAISNSGIELRSTLDKGIGILSPELLIMTSWLMDGPIGKGIKTFARNAILSWKNRGIEKKIRKGQEKYYKGAGKDFSADIDSEEGRQAFYDGLLEDNKNTFSGLMGNFEKVLKKVPAGFMPKKWYEDQVEAIDQKIVGFAQTEEGFKKFTDGIRAKDMENDGIIGALSHNEKLIQSIAEIVDRQDENIVILEPIEKGIEALEKQQIKQGKIYEKSGKTLAAEEQAYQEYREEIAQSGYLQQVDPELVHIFESTIGELRNTMIREERKTANLATKRFKEQQKLENAKYEGNEQDLEKQMKSQKELADNQQSLFKSMMSGSPPYLKTLVDYFTGGAFEKTQEAPAGADVSSPPATKLQDVGSGILDGIRSFLDGLTALVDSAFNFFQSFINGIGNMIQKVAKIVSKTFINLMKGLGEGIAVLFGTLGRIDPVSLAIGAAALVTVATSLFLMGAAMKMAAPFVNAVFGGIAKIISSIGKIIKVVAGAIVQLMEGITENLIKLTQVPFMDYIKLAAAFVVLGTGLAWFGATSYIAIPALLALGVASIGLSQLLKVLPPDQMSLMADGFNKLAKAVKHFGLNSLFLGPAVALLTALSMIPFANKIIDLALLKGDVTGSASPEIFKADTLNVGSIRGAASQALMDGSDRAMQARIENDYQAEKNGGNNIITTTAVNTSENNYLSKPNAQDIGLQNSIVSVVH